MHLPFTRDSLDWVGQEDDFVNVTFYLCNMIFLIAIVIQVGDIYSLCVPKSTYFWNSVQKL